MKCQILLKRLNDIDRQIIFDTNDDVKLVLRTIFDQTWNLIYEQTSDAKFAFVISFHFFKSFRIIFKYYVMMLDEDNILNLTSFEQPYELTKQILQHFNYWTKKEKMQCRLLRLDTNQAIKAKDIEFINIGPIEWEEDE